MLLHRLVPAAVLAVALQPVGKLHSEPLEAVVHAGADKAAEAPSSAAGYYRMGAYRERDGDQRTAFGLAAALRPAAEPGTLAWLTRGTDTEPLAPSHGTPQAGRKELGISYSSDGRVHAYLAERGRPTGPADLHADRPGCCATDPSSPTRGAYYAKGSESPAVASLLGRLKTKGLKLALDDGWKLTAGARSREYSNSVLNSRVGHITLQRWFGDVSTAYSVQLEKRGGWNVAPSQSVQLGYAYAPRSTVGVAYTTGQELAFFGAQGMLKTEVRSLSFQAEHAVEKDWSLRFDAGYYNHGDLPAYRAIRISFRRNL